MNVSNDVRLGAGGVAAALAAGRAAAEAPKDLADLLEKVPASSPEAGQEVCKKLLAGGAATLRQLVGLVGEEFGDPSGVKPKYALHGLIIWASRPGAQAERKLAAETLAAELKAEHSDELKAFLVRQLQWCGRSEEVSALGALLASERLCEPATQALLAIGGAEATAALRAALAQAKGKRRVTIVMALGRQRDASSAGDIKPDAAAAQRDARLVALYALGNMCAGEAADVLLKASDNEVAFERGLAVDACLLLARRLGEQGKGAEAAGVCRKILTKHKAGAFAHERCAALATLAEASGPDAVADVIAAMDSKELRIRVPAARTAVKLARCIRKDHKADGASLLAKVLKATEEKAVLLEAEALAAEA